MMLDKTYVKIEFIDSIVLTYISVVSNLQLETTRNRVQPTQPAV